MFILDCTIAIGPYTFKQVNEVIITKSVDLISDTAEIKLPMSALFGNVETGFARRQLEQEIKAGDPVTITLAYKGLFEKVEFVGFVRWIKPNTPMVTIECEDIVYKVRQKTINKNFVNTTLKKVLEEIVSGTGLPLTGDIPEVKLDSFILKNINGAAALQKLREEYGLFFFVTDDQQLFAGLRQQKNIGEAVAYHLYKNVIEHDLKFRREDDVRLNVKVVGVQKNNTRLEVVVGDPDGEQRTLYFYNISDKATLERRGNAELAEMKYTGYEGDLTGFLVPYATRGMQAMLEDPNYPERAGTYFIPKVVTTFSTGGARRKVEVGTKL